MQRLSLAVLLLTLASAASAQDTSALINKALDEQVNFSRNEPLPRLMEFISNKTGIRIEADPSVWDLLPWGQDTNVKAQFENKTLREALTLITRRLGLTFELKDESIQIQPMPALRRLAQRATIQELQALDLLASTPADLGTDRPSIKELLDKVDQKLLAAKSAFAIENRTADTIDQAKRITVPRNATLMAALDSLPKDTNATWYPKGESIIVTTKENRVRDQLRRRITVRYDGVDVLQVLLDLSSRSGVRFELTPGSIQAIPNDARIIRRAIFENASYQQILDAVGASTGLAWHINQNVVEISNPTGNVSGGARDPLVGILQLDIGVQVILHKSEVPADLQEFIQFKTQKELNKWRQMMQDEGFRPTTRPATTNPADRDERL